MADIKLALVIDSNNPTVGDVYLNDHGTIELVTELRDVVAQALWIRFHFFKGEWFIDPESGVPYFQSILGQKTELDVIGQIFRAVILSVPGIKSLDAFTCVRVPDRGIKVDFASTLDDGTTLTSADFAAFIIGNRG